MKIQLGRKIKDLRKQHNISQEVLAGHLGVTFQAVSKWENEITMPDVTLIPAIASFFGVSTDELFDYNLYEIEQKIEAIVDEYSKYYDHDLERAEKVIREGLEQYPGNDTFLNCLIGAIPVPERSAEVIALCKQLIENTKYDDVKYDACRIMAEAYASIDEYELAKATIERIPKIYFSKLEVAALLLKGEDMLEAAKKERNLSLSFLIEMLERLADYNESEVQDYPAAISQLEIAKRVIEAFEKENIYVGYREEYERIISRIELLTKKH